MKRVISIFIVIIIVFRSSSGSASEDQNSAKDSDFDKNLTPKLSRPLKLSLQVSLNASRDPKNEKQFKGFPQDLKKSLLQNKKTYEELLSKNKLYFQSLLERTKQSNPKSHGKPTPRHVSPEGHQYSERDTGNKLDVTKAYESAPERKSDAILKSNVADSVISHGAAIEESQSLHPVNFQPSEEDRTNRNERGEKGGKKLLFTLQLPGASSRAPESFVCHPVSQGVNSGGEIPEPFITATSPYSGTHHCHHVSQNFQASEFDVPETRAETEFRSSLRHNMKHLDNEPVKTNDDKVLNDVVSKLKSAVLTFEDQMKYSESRRASGQVEPTDVLIGENDEKITRKFLTFVQKFLGLYDSDGSNFDPDGASFAYPSKVSAEAVPSSFSLSSSPSSTDSYSAPGFTYPSGSPETLDSIQTHVSPLVEVSVPSVSYPQKSQFQYSDSHNTKNTAATDFAYPEKSRQFINEASAYVGASTEQSSFLSSKSQANHSITESEALSKHVPSTLPRVILSSELSKYFPSVGETAGQAVGQTQGGVGADSGHETVKWRVISPQRDPIPEYYGGAISGSQRWSISPAAQKPNQFTLTENIPRIPHFDQGVTGVTHFAAPQAETHPSGHYKIPDFEYGVSAEADTEIPQTATYPTVRAASKTEAPTDHDVEPVNEPLRQKDYIKAQKQKATHKNRNNHAKSTDESDQDFRETLRAQEPQKAPKSRGKTFSTSTNINIPADTQHQTLPNQYSDVAPAFNNIQHSVTEYQNVPNPDITKSVTIPAFSENQHRTFSIGSASTYSSGTPTLVNAPVVIQRTNPSTFVVKHEEPYVINYQSPPYIVDVVRNPKNDGEEKS